MGHRVTVVARSGVDGRGRVADPLLQEVVVPAATATWPRRAGPRLESWRWGRLVARVARRVRPDLLWERAWAGPGADAGQRVARAVGAAHLLEVNAPLSLERSAARSVGRTLREVSRRTRRADRVVVVSPWLVEHVKRLAPSAEVVEVSNGSDLACPHAPREAIRESLGWDGPVAVHHGTLRAWHGWSGRSVVRMLDRFSAAGWRVVVAGDAPEGAQVVDHPGLDRLPHADSEALARMLYAADVGLAPYPAAAPAWLDPLKLADCAAIGLPVVGSVHPATRRCAVQVPLHDPDAWVRAAESVRGQRTARPRPWSQVCTEALAGWDCRFAS